MAKIYHGILLSHKKEWNNALCSNMYGPRLYHTKWNKPDKDKYHTMLYVETKIWHKLTYLWNRNRLTDIENRFVVAKGKSGTRGMDWEFGVSRCKLLHIEWINDKVLLYNTGNYTQYSVINHNEKDYIYIYIYIYIYVCMYVYLSHFALQQINAT